ncbi:putative serine/threonine-protein kinase PBL28 [Bidens hawaiensis]|uniref:putative serine/threonine-protein kinase PBL28 n=1 Tax=Bidens hawaiensis TaxID=980011 RepID=UPI00404A5EBA
MSNLLKELDHLRIPLDDIKSATDNFDKQNFLGEGGFGPVYKGLHPSSTRSEGDTAVAVKKLNVKGLQGEHEFIREIVMLASYKHDNLVSLVGFCDDTDEKVLVYKQEVNGSLYDHLDSTNLTWEQRLRICLGAAQGLEYLHDGVGAEHRVLHRNIKSSNILLDSNWVAKISDFGFSKIGPANQQFTFLVTNACGTFGYCDPLYVKTGVLTKESDVYSFGVVLFEVMCGRPAMVTEFEDERTFLSGWVKFHQEKGTLHKIILANLVEKIEPDSLQVFYDIAFQCLDEDHKQRPTMTSVVIELETALQHQLVPPVTISEPLFGQGPRTRLWGSTTDGKPYMYQLNSDRRINHLVIYYSTSICALAFSVIDSEGNLCSTHQIGGVHARLSDYNFYEMTIDADEEIIGMSGTVGKYGTYGGILCSLCFVTNKKKFDPFGQKNKTKACTRFQGSWGFGLFNGFYGLGSGYSLHALGCLLKDLKTTSLPLPFERLLFLIYKKSEFWTLIISFVFFTVTK